MKLMNSRNALLGLTLGSAFVYAGLNTAALAQEETKPVQRRTWQAPTPQVRTMPASGLRVERRRGEEFGPRISKDELAQMKTALKADETQIMLFDAAYDGYRAAVMEASKAMQNQRPMMFRSGGKFDQDAMRRRMTEMREASEAYRLERDRLQGEFLDSVHALLEQHQEALWGSYQKGLRRRTTLNRLASLKGEGVDLVKLTSDLELSADQTRSLENVLKQYTNELDDALRARNVLLEKVDAQFQSFDPMGGRGMGLDEKVRELMDKSTRQRLAVVNVNQRFVPQIASTLDHRTGAEFQEAFDHACFPRIFRDTRADKYIEKLNGDEGLTPVQHQSIDLVANDYGQNIVPLNRRLADLEWQKQADMRSNINRTPGYEAPHQMRTIAIRSTGGGSSIMMNPGMDSEMKARIDKAKDQKNDLVNNTISALFAALTPEQQERFPKPKPVTRFSGGNLAQYLGNGANINFDGMDFPEGFNAVRLVELLEGIQLEIGDGDGSVTVHAVSIGQIEGMEGEDGERVGVFIAIEAESDDKDGDGEDEEDDGKDDGDGG